MKRKGKQAVKPLDKPDAPRAGEGQTLFLEAFAKLGNVTEAAEVSNVGRSTHYEWLETDPQYAKRFQAVKDRFADLIRKTVRERSIDLWDVDNRAAVRLLELMAKAHCPEFREKHEITGPGGEALKIEVVTGVPQAGE